MHEAVVGTRARAEPGQKTGFGLAAGSRTKSIVRLRADRTFLTTKTTTGELQVTPLDLHPPGGKPALGGNSGEILRWG
jgi:hypothetical protein